MNGLFVVDRENSRHRKMRTMLGPRVVQVAMASPGLARVAIVEAVAIVAANLVLLVVLSLVKVEQG